MTTPIQPEPTNEQRRIIYQARRGLKELDFYIDLYVKEIYLTAEPAEQETFAEMLTHEDPDLLDYFTNQNRPENEEIWALVNKIKTWRHNQRFDLKTDLDIKNVCLELV
ncbi:succinate dehydrogenase assembly factor 2 [Psychrobacter sp. WY6]|uniref:FAD assembly factor SdhE n=1 Tax=Psychrobacter sp. WY6 TaxID=2708350 RepID=UPI002022D75F|nr:succinate dehydrogenase assembly factor 2 [Psychrobacter sp. WY6]